MDPQTSGDLWALLCMLSSFEADFLLAPGQLRPFGVAANYWSLAIETYERFMPWVSPDALPINPPPKNPGILRGPPRRTVSRPRRPRPRASLGEGHRPHRSLRTLSLRRGYPPRLLAADTIVQLCKEEGFA